MDDYEARVIRIYQYLLSKDVALKQRITDKKRLIQCNNLDPADLLSLWESIIRLEIWDQFCFEVWNLLR